MTCLRIINTTLANSIPPKKTHCLLRLV